MLVILKRASIDIIIVKSEIQLSEELGINVSYIRNIRKKFLSRSQWTKSDDMVYYTKEGEHSIRNELMIRVFATMD